MFPPSAYDKPVGSFQSPVTPPGVEVDATPTCTITISQAWVPYVLGALSQLCLPATWIGDPETIELAQQRAMTLRDLFACGAEIAFACPYDFTDNDGGWVGFPISIAGYSPSPIAQWVSSAGWSIVDSDNGPDTLRACYIMLATDPSSTVTSVTFDYALIKGVALLGGWISGVQFFDSAFSLLGGSYVGYQTLPDTSSGTFNFTGAVTGASWVLCALTCDFNATGPVSGDATIRSARVNGFGATPCP